jgi:hypothetical protein
VTSAYAKTHPGSAEPSREARLRLRKGLEPATGADVCLRCVIEDVFLVRLILDEIRPARVEPRILGIT